MDRKGNEVIETKVVSGETLDQCSDDLKTTEIGSDSECYLVNLCTKPSNHEVRHYLKGKCQIIADLGESQEVYVKEEFIPCNTMISLADMPNPKEVFGTDYGPTIPKPDHKPLVIDVVSGIKKGNQKPYRITELGSSGSTLNKIAEESIYWRLDKPILYGKEFDFLTKVGRQRAEDQIKKNDPDLIVAQWIGNILSLTRQHSQRFLIAKTKTMLQWLQELWTWQRDRGKLWIGEHPSNVQLWKETAIRRMLSDSWSSEQSGIQMVYCHTIELLNSEDKIIVFKLGRKQC